MSSQRTIFSLQAAPGDSPIGMEQPNGDLLVPANARPMIAQALIAAEQALEQGHAVDPALLQRARELLGVQMPDTRNAWKSNLFRVREI
jgi:hypothetical protein